MTANNTVEAADRPILLVQCLIGDLERELIYLRTQVLMRGMKAI
jgi:hypothetical protein